jgi:prepilin-type N-terminal cleavage/methylation domain-containing protein
MAPTMPNAEGRPAGFSLVELMMVLVVVGITLAAGTPFFRGYMQSRGIGASTNDLVAQIDLARNRAIAENNPYRVLLNSPEAGQYRVHDDKNANGSIDGGEAVYGPFRLSGTVGFQAIEIGGGNVIVFEASGMLPAGQGGRITLADDSGRSRILEVYTSGVTTLAENQ